MTERRPSHNSQGESELLDSRMSRTSPRGSREFSRTSSRPSSRAPSRPPPPGRSPSSLSFDGFRLPPPPDLISDDYEAPLSPSIITRHPNNDAPHHTRSLTMPTTLSPQQRLNAPPLSGVKQHAKLSEQETHVAVELIFAVINELYTLSDARCSRQPNRSFSGQETPRSCLSSPSYNPRSSTSTRRTPALRRTFARSGKAPCPRRRSGRTGRPR
jgi:hypothetical protein